jgi:DNA-binding NarL/FixJ family response regulator
MRRAETAQNTEQNLAPAGGRSSASRPCGTNTERRRFRLVLADDHYDVREEVRHLLASQFDILCSVGDGPALLEAAKELKPDAIVTDVRMPHMSGIQASERLLSSGLSVAVVVLSMHSDSNLVNAALQAGIGAYVLKVDAGEELIPAIYAALRGERYLSQGVRDQYRA